MGSVGHDEPLGRLLAMALRLVIDDLHDRLAAAGWGPIRPLSGFALLALRDEPGNVSQLGEVLGVTKQASAKLVAGLLQAGLVAQQLDPVDRRATIVSLSDRGRSFLRAAESAYVEIEAEWSAIVGRERFQQLSADIASVVASRYPSGSPPLRPVA